MNRATLIGRNCKFTQDLTAGLIAIAISISPALADETITNFEPTEADNRPNYATPSPAIEPTQPLIPEESHPPAITEPPTTTAPNVAKTSKRSQNSPAPTKPRRLSNHNVKRFLVGTLYVTAKGVAGFCQGYGYAYRNNNFYNNSNNNMGSINTIGPSGLHGYSYNTVGNMTTVQQLY
jgi:hypothetical protein